MLSPGENYPMTMQLMEGVDPLRIKLRRIWDAKGSCLAIRFRISFIVHVQILSTEWTT